MSTLEDFGVSAGELAGHQTVKYPKPVQGRVVHIDADFMAYQVSAESNEELDPKNPTPRKSLQDMKHNAKIAAEHLMKLAGATEYVCHTTPSGSTKGGRREQAIQQEYQANRKDRENTPEHLDTIRTYIGRELNGKVHMDQEADDGMAQAAWNAEDANLTVVASADKDLLMVPGLHLIPTTGKLLRLKDNFGYLEIIEKTGSMGKVTKKVTGLGTKFFWLQCLMGDTADNIKGVPHVTGDIWQEYQPTQEYLKVCKQWVDLPPRAGLTGAALKAAERLDKSLEGLRRKTKLCGQMLAYALLEDCENDVQCFNRVLDIWKLAEKRGHEFVHWNTGKKVTATQTLLGEMRLLWMRRNKNPDDVLDWLKEIKDENAKLHMR